MEKKSYKDKSKKLVITASDSETLYDKDYCLWVKTQAELIGNKKFDCLDIINLIEEIESLRKSERRFLESHLENLLMHMLKKKYQPTKASRSWDLSIKEASFKANKILKQNPSLKPELKEFLKDSYYSARLEASRETGLDEKTFPKNCEWTIKEILG